MKKAGMNMYRSCLNRPGNDRGVTVMEILITLILLSAVMTGIFRMGSALYPVFERERGRIIALGKERLILRVMEKEIARINPPWWLSNYEMTEDEELWMLPWYKGEKDEFLILSRVRGNFTMGNSWGLLLSIKDSGPLDFILLKAANGSPFLLRAEGDLFSEGEAYFLLGSRIVPGAPLP